MTVESAPAPHVAARTAGATALVMSGATLAHTWAGGALPDTPQLLALSGVVYGAGALVLRWRVPLVLLVPLLFLAQAGLHVMFGSLAMSETHTGHAGIATTPSDAPLGWRMVLAHLLSALLAWLVWWMSQRTATLLLRLRDLWTPYIGGRRDATSCLPAVERPGVLVCLVGAPRRGPPACVV